MKKDVIRELERVINVTNGRYDRATKDENESKSEESKAYFYGQRVALSGISQLLKKYVEYLKTQEEQSTKENTEE